MTLRKLHSISREGNTCNNTIIQEQCGVTICYQCRLLSLFYGDFVSGQQRIHGDKTQLIWSMRVLYLAQSF